MYDHTPVAVSSCMSTTGHLNFTPAATSAASLGSTAKSPGSQRDGGSPSLCSIVVSPGLENDQSPSIWTSFA